MDVDLGQKAEYAMNVERVFHIMELFLAREIAVAKTEVVGAQAVERASYLLIHIIEATTAPLLSQLALEHDLPKSTTSRLLAALERQGLITRNRVGAFLPGTILNRYARQRNHEMVVCGHEPHCGLGLEWWRFCHA